MPVDRVDTLRRAWRRLGEPVTAPGRPHGKAVRPHPLIASIEDAEAHVLVFARSLGLTPDGYRKVKPRLGRPREIVPALPSAKRAREEHLTPVG